LLVIAFLAQGGMAQEVQWRYDYNAARKEAKEKGLPLLLDFGTVNCFWCRKLDETTLRDPTISRALNEQFIPLKVDAQRSPTLTELLRVQSFPTVVLAAPDGKILGTMEGYTETGRFLEHLNRALASVANPEWMAKDYEEATQAVAAGDYTRAVALLKSIGEDGQRRPIQVKARTLLADLEQQAAVRLARAKQLEDKGQTTEAVDTLTNLLKTYGGTQAAATGGEMLTALAAKPAPKADQRARRARELLALAREEYRTQQYLSCIDHCETLSTSYSDLPEGADGLQLAADIKNNPEWLRAACETLSERLANLYLALAQSELQRTQSGQAVVYLERVIQAFPGTRQAEIAQTRLSLLQNQPKRHTDLKK
jgi:thioredoxin-like negative regulator of GroEL